MTAVSFNFSFQSIMDFIYFLPWVFVVGIVWGFAEDIGWKFSRQIRGEEE